MGVHESVSREGVSGWGEQVIGGNGKRWRRRKEGGDEEVEVVVLVVEGGRKGVFDKMMRGGEEKLGRNFGRGRKGGGGKRR